MSPLDLDRSGGQPALRIGYVLKRFPRLSETFILNEILELERQGVHVEVFSLLKPPEEPQHDLLARLKAPIYYLPSARTLELLEVREADGQGTSEKASILKLLGDEAVLPELMPGKSAEDRVALLLRASIIALLALSRGLSHLHGHFGSDAATAALLAGRLARLPFSYTAHARDIYHTYIDPETDDRMRRLKMAEAAFVVTVSDFNKAHLRSVAEADSARIERLYNGIDLSRFSFSGIEQRDPREVLAVGRLIEKKGYFDLIEAARLLVARGVDFRLSIVGDGPLRGEIERRIETHGLKDRVKLLGIMPQVDVVDRMRRAGCFALPCMVAKSGDRDGLPTVLLEAQAIGLPVISTSVAGIPEIITDGVDGLLVPPETPAALADAIERLLGSAALRTSLALAGRQKAESHFSLSTNVDRLRRLFAEISSMALT